MGSIATRLKIIEALRGKLRHLAEQAEAKADELRGKVPADLLDDAAECIGRFRAAVKDPDFTEGYLADLCGHAGRLLHYLDAETIIARHLAEEEQS